jgi:predicted phosphodiesterase
MRLALLSDIHGNLAALNAVVEDMGQRGVDAVANLGDSLSGPLLPAETAAYLMAQPWTHLAGNHERQLLELSERSGASDRYAHAQLGEEAFDWMAGLKPALAFSSEVFLCHGTPRSDVEGLLESVDGGIMKLASLFEIDERLGAIRAEVVACGHTHVPRVMRSPSGQLLVNPGSVGLQAYEGESGDYVVENGSPDARYAIIERRGGAWTAALIAVPYDPAEMVRLARLRERPDWEAALASGYIRSSTGDTRP